MLWWEELEGSSSSAEHPTENSQLWPDGGQSPSKQQPEQARITITKSPQDYQLQATHSSPNFPNLLIKKNARNKGEERERQIDLQPSAQPHLLLWVRISLMPEQQHWQKKMPRIGKKQKLTGHPLKITQLMCLRSLHYLSYFSSLEI